MRLSYGNRGHFLFKLPHGRTQSDIVFALHWSVVLPLWKLFFRQFSVLDCCLTEYNKIWLKFRVKQRPKCKAWKVGVPTAKWQLSAQDISIGEVFTKTSWTNWSLCMWTSSGDTFFNMCLRKNANDCFAGMLWQRVPKDLFLGPHTLFGL